MRVQKLNKRKLKKLNHKGLCYFDKQLKDFNTFRINAIAKVFLQINTIENLLDVMWYLKSIGQKYFVLGGGSNVLVRDYDGVVIKLGGDFQQIEEFDGIIEMGAGVEMFRAYNFCREHSLGGFEESVGIPGTIGGATYMNASCYDFEMSKLIDYVVALDVLSQKIKFLKAKDCKFGYRTSVFDGGDFVIMRVGLKLLPKGIGEMEDLRKNALSKRLASQPKGFSAGCVFKKINNQNVSKMLDDMGIKGKSVGGAVVSNKHANFILNDGSATYQDIQSLILDIQEQFEQTYNEKLEREIKYLGE